MFLVILVVSDHVKLGKNVTLIFYNDNNNSDHNNHNNNNDNDNNNNNDNNKNTDNYTKMLEDNGQESRLVTLQSHGRLQKIILLNVIILRIFKE